MTKIELDIFKHPTLYKRTKTGAIQVWSVEQYGNKYRTVHGQKDGLLITSEWTVCERKNVGKKNERSGLEQANEEVISLYTKKCNQGKYTSDFTVVDESSYISPMLAEPYDPATLSFPIFAQPKLDGVRCILKKDGAFTRKGKRVIAAQHLVDDLQPVFKKYPWLILDGELYNHKFKKSFEELISLVKKIYLTEEDIAFGKNNLQYHIYDIVNDEPYFIRKQVIENLFKDCDELKTDSFHQVYTVECYSDQEFKNEYKEFMEADYEGAIARTQNAPYTHYRCFYLQKYKEFIDEEFEVADIREGKGNWAGHAKIAILWLPGADKSKGIILKTKKGKKGQPDEVQNAFGAGVKGNKEYAKRLLANKDKVIGKPGTTTYFRKTAYGIPYLPVFKVVRDYE